MSEQTNQGSRRIVVNVVVAVLIVAVVVLIVRHYSKTKIEIRAARAGYTDMISSISTNGKVEPLAPFQAHAVEGGTVEQVAVRMGEHVTAGTLLLRMNSAAVVSRVQTARSAVAAAQAAEYDISHGGSSDERIGLNGDIDRAKLQAAQTQRDVAALQALQAKGAASASEVAAAQSRLASATSSLNSMQARTTGRYSATDRQRVQAQLTDSRATLAAATQSMSNAVIRAPFAGTIYSLPVKQYDFVPAGDELVQVADLSRVQVRAYFDEPEIGKLRLGDAVIITWDARPGQTWHGHIVRVPTAVITYGTRNVGECLIAVDDATGELLPNTNVTVMVTTQQIFHILSLPREGLHTQGPESFVYLVQNEQLTKRVIQVGALNLTVVQVTGGLQPGDVVALNPTTSNLDLTEGLAVRVRP